jgi:1-acyl-sn-glycerol-3-phosphate acyltransferase
MSQRQYTSWHHGFFLKIFILIFGPFFRIHYRIKLHKISIKKTGPYLILANHTAEFDIIFLNMLFDAPLYFVASEQLLNSGKGSWFLKTFFNPIPKSKSMADFGVVKRIKQVLSEGGNVAIFPEGNASMQGGPSRIPPGIGKLIKFLQVPVKLIGIHGLYLSAPRWAYFRKFGPTRIEEITTLTLKDISQHTAESLDALVKKTLAISAYEEPLGRFRGRRRAEGLHKLIFTCPSCAGMLTTYSKNDHLRCHACSFEGFYDEKGYLQYQGKALPLTVLDQENKERFHQFMKHNWSNFQHQVVAFVASWSGGKTKRRPFLKHGVQFSKDGIKLGHHKQSQIIPYEAITSEAIQVRTKLILYLHEGPTLLLKFPRSISPFACLMIIQWYKHHIKEGVYHELDSNLRYADSVLGI